MKRFYLFFVFTFSFFSVSLFAGVETQADTVVVPHADVLPTIDGVIDGTEWDGAVWQTIDAMWMDGGSEAPDNAVIDSADFTGKFKVMWNSTTNMLYFLVVTTDDGDFDAASSSDSYSNYDCIEIFIDEDRSGGLHLMDGTGKVWNIDRGEGENAFAYHIVPKTNLNTNASSSTAWFMDLGGTPSDNSPVAIDYVSHFPSFNVTRVGQEYTWEFAMKIYDDTYTDSDPSASRVTLSVGKIMGLSVAYNDDDDGGARDNMYGSVYHEIEADRNASYYNASVFGVMKLVQGNTAPTVANPIADINLTSLVTTLASDNINSVFADAEGGLIFSTNSDNAKLTATIEDGMLFVIPASDFSGVATVTVTATDGIESVQDEFKVSYTTSVLNYNSSDFNVYPNPATNTVNLSLNSIQADALNISILNVTGQLVYTEYNVNKQQFSFDVSGLNKGVYFIQVDTKEKMLTQKLIIK